MEVIRGGARLPRRRLTQMYADTKRSYEQFVQTSEITNPKVSSLHLKLRIQKDRLFAWGLEWRDSGAAQSGDIDGSLDRAGISDLVASIMSSINELLVEAESMQPRRRKESAGGAFTMEKLGDFSVIDAPWSSENVTRLEDIVKDITTSIDTLCDLSRTQSVLRRETTLQDERQASSMVKGDRFSPAPKPSAEKGTSNNPGLAFWSRLYPNQIRIPESKALPRSSPPSYESVAARSEDRVFAYLLSPPSSELGARIPQEFRSEKAVLLDYGVVHDSDTFRAQLPSLRRYDDLVSALQSSQSHAGSAYTRTMKIIGWFEDPHRLRYVFVYEVPDPPLGPPIANKTSSMPHTLLSYLQYGADTDSSNMPCLEDRYRLAFNIASLILHLHAKGVTHRNINSNNILFFTADSSPTSEESKSWKLGVIRHPFMTSFDQCDEDAPAPHNEPFISGIYRHPRIERGQRSVYRPAHDIYSLGIILLEIGLWMPIHKLWKPKYVRPDFKTRMQSVYIKKLAAKCGSAYMRVVDYCLRAADEETPVHTDSDPISAKSQESTKLQIDYYWKAIRPLERCCSIDDVEEPGTRSGTSTIDSVELQRGEVHPIRAETAPPTISLSAENRPQEHQPPSPSEDVKPKLQPKCGKLKVWSHELPLPCAKYWNATMLPELERILRRINNQWESYTVELFMAGENAEQARPTIYMMCASVQKVRKALQYLNREKELFDIKVVSGQITRSKAGKKKRRGKQDRTSNEDMPGGLDNTSNLNPYYQERPACGASIGAYMDKQHLPPVSFGGTVLVDGEPYGMSVHHMLENEEADSGLGEDVKLQKSMAHDSPVQCDEGILAYSWSPEALLPEALYPFEMSEDEEDGYESSIGDDESWLFSDDPLEQCDEEDGMDMGDTIGIKPCEGKDLIVTQPAIDDVTDGFFPNHEDMNEEHLTSHNFGHIHASSGIKRANQGAISHEVDWALIKVNPHRLREENLVTGGALHCESKKLASSAKTLDREAINKSPIHESASYPCQVVKTEELGGLRVHALGRTSGLQTGVILPTMALVKMPGRVSFSHSWQVRGGFGGMSSHQVGGDSGAWVVDNASGRVCAHVLAWSARNSIAYIAPMEVLLDDMAHTLGAKVALPHSQQLALASKKGFSKQNGDSSHAIYTTMDNLSIAQNHAKPEFSRSPQRSQSAQEFSTKMLARKPVPAAPSTPSYFPPKIPSFPHIKQKGPYELVQGSPYHPQADDQTSKTQSSLRSFDARSAYPTPSPTPSLSPPVATSPPCLPHLDNIAQQGYPRTDILCTIATTFSPPFEFGHHNHRNNTYPPPPLPTRPAPTAFGFGGPPQSRREMLVGGVEANKGRGRGGTAGGSMGRVRGVGGRGVETKG